MDYTLDACAGNFAASGALIALFKRDEQGGEKIRDLPSEAEAGNTVISMSIVNLVEVYYGFIGELGEIKAIEILEQIYALPIKIIDTINTSVFDEASRLKSTYALSIADAIGLATAINLKSVFVTGDGEFVEPESAERVPISWFRPPKKK
jgi:predicted nucleic acid-binding protein